MRIKSLQVHGFKSFVDPTTFSFKDGITAVVGPNGCGKSNVVDAIRWVMGEQSARRLRGNGMDDVIFAGSENRPPIGMAEVILTFSNEDGRAPADYAQFSEIQICRRLYRSGESEYLINKAQSRLKDVHDFFRDPGIGTKGYTIIEQGKVAEIVSARPDERRQLIEEAAGINKYKARRREAESKIKSTELNLQRVSDVLAEIKRQISSLERQARKAARFKRLKETQRILELSLAADERRELLEELEKAQACLTGFQEKVTALSTQLAERELALEEKRIGLTEAEKAVAEGAEQLFALRGEIKDLEGKLELGQREHENIGESNEGRRRELESLQEQLTQAESDALGTRHELEELESAVLGQRTNVEAAEQEAEAARGRLLEAETDCDRGNQALLEVMTSITRDEDRLAHLADQRDLVDQRLRTADRDFELQQAAASEASRDQEALEEGLRNLLSERDRFQEQLIEALNQHERAKEDVRTSSEALRSVSESHQASKARLSALKDLLEKQEDVPPGTRHLMDEGGSAAERYGAQGLVKDLLTVDSEVERAVGVVLAERADALVMADSSRTVEAMDFLRAEKAGRGSFLVQSGQSAVSGIVPLGVPLIEFVRPREGHEELVGNLLGDVYLVESLAEPFGHYGAGSLPATFVTRSGDVVTPDGLVRGGGHENARGSLARQAEVTELEVQVQSLSSEVEQLEANHQRMEQGLQSASQELDNLRSRHHTAALAVANHEKDLERAAERLKTIAEAQESRSAERSSWLAEIETLTAEQHRLEEEVVSFRGVRSQRQSEVDAKGLQVSSLARDSSRLETRLTELRVAHEARVENRDRLNEAVSRADESTRQKVEWISQREREIEAGLSRQGEIENEKQTAEASLSTLLVSEEEERVKSDGIRDAHQAQAETVRSLDDALRDLRGELSQQQTEVSSAELALREGEMRLTHQSESIRDRWNVDIAAWEIPVPGEAPETIPAAPELSEAEIAEAEVAARLQGQPAPDAAVESENGEVSASDVATALKEAHRNAELAGAPREERERELEGLRKTLESLGEVNLGAIEEHEELAERFRFLSEQQTDLQETIGSLREAISRINRTSRTRFKKTFEEVSAHFSENFPRLFGGGKASLELLESDDVLEAGIDIMAMPPGKRLQNVNLLSGGEKTMTALALLVALFQVRPSPFFLLDEVDAALDDANVGRFNGLIADLAESSQFLVITHNKRTIEVADVLYGVTMEKKGVSKLVGVELN
ncbi:MAG: chromosome segregation protein SMC [Myxococcota bacterium]|nr:chromosome segregation protein SMC [Myxococcota bacterium]